MFEPAVAGRRLTVILVGYELVSFHPLSYPPLPRREYPLQPLRPCRALILSLSLREYSLRFR